MSDLFFFVVLVFMIKFHNGSAACPEGQRRDMNDCSACLPGLDLSTNCDTCLPSGDIQCLEGAEEDCVFGDFIFSAQFLSYQNPNHVCAECPNGPAVCGTGVHDDIDAIIEEELNDILSGLIDDIDIDGIIDDELDDTVPFNCNLRFLYCLQPYGSPQLTGVSLPPQQPLPGGDHVIFDEEEDFIIQNNNNARWNRSNPYTVELGVWPGRIQFDVIVYSFLATGPAIPAVVDRFLIDLTLPIGSVVTDTYYGIHTVSQFDLTFSVQCSNVGMDPDTNCTQCLPGRDPDTDCTQCLPGRDPDTDCTQCLPGRDPDTDCTQCLPGRDPDTDCTQCLPGRDPASNCAQCFETTCTANNMQFSDLSSVLIGALAGSVASVLLLMIVVLLGMLLLCRVYRRNRAAKKATPPTIASSHAEPSLPSEVASSHGQPSPEVSSHARSGILLPESEEFQEMFHMTSNQVYGVSITAAVQRSEDLIEMRQNQAYGIGVSGEGAVDKKLCGNNMEYDYI